MKSISYRQEMEYTKQICIPESHGVLHSFNSGNWATNYCDNFLSKWGTGLPQLEE